MGLLSVADATSKRQEMALTAEGSKELQKSKRVMYLINNTHFENGSWVLYLLFKSRVAPGK